MYRPSQSGFATKAIQHRLFTDKVKINEDPNYSSETTTLSKMLAILEDAEYALVFPSGISAASTLLSLLRAGDHILVCSEIYGGTDQIIRKVFQNFDIEFTFITASTDVSLISTSIKSNTKMVFFETPSNPLTTVTDIKGVVDEVRNFSRDIIIAIDNTFLSPYFQKPLEFGVDIVMYSLTKYMGGHSDVTLGALVTNSYMNYNSLQNLQRRMGSYPSAFECDLVIQGIKSLKVRMDRIQKTSLKLAEFLERHPKIEKVRHPSLPSHPQHKLALEQSFGFSGVFSFYIRNGTLEDSKKLFESMKMVAGAASLGGTETLMQIPVLTSHVMIPAEERLKLKIFDNLVRISVGLEDVEDLIEDFEQALDKIDV